MSIDIILLAFILIFIILRLRSLLGTRSEEDVIFDLKNNIVKQQQEEKILDDIIEKTLENKFNIDDKVKEKIQHVKNIDNNFELVDFANGAINAFQIIIKAYSEGDKDTLKNLLSPQLLTAFSKNIDEQNNKEAKMETTIISAEIEKILNISIKGSVVAIKLEFKSEQINVIKNNDGKIISGDASHVDEINDIWTFENDLASSDPTWYLVKTS